jgi:hypothetical protein
MRMFARVTGLLAVVMLIGVGAAPAIVVDGVNDFDPADLVDPDGGDTQFAPIDMLDVYIAYDETAIYIGYGHDQDGWTGVQVGIAFATSIHPGGGTTDPWGHQIGFMGACLPDFIAYVNCDSHWNEWCVWNGMDWDRTPNIINWVDSTAFDELEVTYDMLGVDCAEFSQVFVELWVTQDGDTKGPLDLSYDDALQLSTPDNTIWDIDTPVMLSCYHCINLYGPSAAEGVTWGGIKRLYR